MSAALKLEENAQVTAINQQIAQYRPLKIVNADAFLLAADQLKAVKAAQKELKAVEAQIVAPIKAGLQKLASFFRVPSDKLDAIEKEIKAAMLTYTREQEAIRLSEQRKADAEAAKKRAALEKREARAVEAGKFDRAEMLAEQSRSVVAPVIQREAPKVAGVSQRDNWQFRIVCAAKLPREFLMPDEPKIRRQVKAMGADAHIDGVEIYNDPIIAAGSK